MCGLRFSVVALPLLLLSFAACDALKRRPAGDGGAEASTSASASASATAASAGTATSLAAFEGDIAMRMTAPRQPQAIDVTYEIKADKMRVDLGSPAPGLPGAWEIVDRKTNKIYTVLDAQKIVMVMDLDAAARQRAGQKPEYKVEKTGKTETILGHTCQVWVMTSKDTRADVCVVEGVQGLTAGMVGSTPGADVGWSVGLESEGAFPLRVVAHDAAGAEAVRIEAVRIERKAIDDARFQVPKGYRQMNAPGVPGGAPAPPRKR